MRPKTIQNALLDSIYEVCRTFILDEINKAHYIAIQADETTDSATLSQLVFNIPDQKWVSYCDRSKISNC
jgi:hypothetical protein